MTKPSKTLMGYPVIELPEGESSLWMLSLDENTAFEAEGTWEEVKPVLERQVKDYQNTELARIYDEVEGKRCCGKCSCGDSPRKREDALESVLIPDRGDVSSLDGKTCEGQIITSESLFGAVYNLMGDCHKHEIRIHLIGGGTLLPREVWSSDGVLHIEGEVSK